MTKNRSRAGRLHAVGAPVDPVRHHDVMCVPMHILVVEDDETNRRGTIRILESAGHTTCWAGTGEGALGLLRTEKVDLVVLDMMLGPGLNGWEVAFRCRLSPKTARIPIIVLTGLQVDDVKSRGEEPILSGVVTVMGKPVDVPELLHVIESLDTRRQWMAPKSDTIQLPSAQSHVPSGATRVDIHFGKYARVTWFGRDKGAAAWDVWTGNRLQLSFSTMSEACSWADQYARARAKMVIEQGLPDEEGDDDA